MCYISKFMVTCCTARNQFPGWLSSKESPAVQETPGKQVQSLGQEGPLEEEMATHSSFLAWRIPWTEVGYSPYDCKESDMTEAT